MHTTTKDVVTDKDKAAELDVELGAHILSTTIEADGPFQIASPLAKFHAEVIAVRRTDSGGVFVQTALHIVEPVPAAPAAAPVPEVLPTPEELATEYLKEKGLTDGEAKTAVDRFGAAKILRKQTEERDSELSALLATPAKAAEPKQLGEGANEQHS